MNKEIFIISSSDSDTDKNSDYDFPASTVFIRGAPEKIPTSTRFRLLEHDLSDGNSESESLPDIPLAPSDALVGFPQCFPSIHSETEEHAWKCSDFVTSRETVNAQQNEYVSSQTSGSQLSSQTSSATSSTSSYINLTVVIEISFCQEKFYDTLKSSLDAAKIPYTLEEQMLQGVVCWKDETHSNFVEDQVVQLLNCSEVTEMVSNFKNSSTSAHGHTLLTRAHEIFQKSNSSKVTFIIFGMEKYFRSHKSKHAREFREIVSGEMLSQQTRKRKNKKDLPYITKIDLEEAIVDLQLQTNVNVRLIENAQELADIIVSFTTSIKDAPRKRAKQDHNFNWHVHGDSFGTVKVGKDMMGLSELWVQQLMQFHQVSKDTALTIASKYPSPQALLKAYRKCSSKIEASRLLENIEVRRGTALFSTTKRVGPELSYKIHALLTTKDSDEILHTARD